MRPQRATLIRTIQNAVAILAGQTDRPESKSLLNVIDACANELLLRADPSFYIDYHARGLELVDRGSALLGVPSNGAPCNLKTNEPLEAIEATVEDVTLEIERIVHTFGASRDPAVLAYFCDVTEWEVSLYARRLTRAPRSGRSAPIDARLNRDSLQAYLRARRTDLTDLEVTEFRLVPGGFSKLTVLFEIRDSTQGRQSLIARFEPPVKFMELDGMDLRNEFPVVKLAARSGLPVAEPLWMEEDAGIFGMRFFISRKVPGEIYGTVKAMDRPLAPDVIRKLAKLLADIHAVRPDRDDPLIQHSHIRRWLDFPTLAQNTLGLVDYWADQAKINGAEASPILTRAIDWLRANVPPENEPFSLIHGDFGLHNLLIENGEVRALLDWENSRIGDPAEEFAHFFAAVGGKIDQTEFLRHYRAAGGRSFSAFRLRYFEVYDCTNVSIACLATLARLDNFEQANVNWSVFGLHFLHHYAARILPLIQEAEAVQERATQ
jgi:aminoglycoside phosphotransferase (APT) family kinase protein